LKKVLVEALRRLVVIGQLAPVVIERRPVDNVRVHELVQVLLDQTVQMVAILLQVGLPLLEEVLLDFLHFLVLVVAIGIGPLEHVARLDYRLAAEFKELKLFRRVILDLVQHVALVLEHGQLLDGQLSRAVMIGVPLVVPHVPLKFSFDIVALLLLLRKALVFFLFLVQVALVVAACRAAMILPVAHADPAELVTALNARHMVAALILFDVLLTLGAGLRISRNPVHIF